MKIYDLSQPLNQDSFFWPYYPPFEVKYIKRKVEHGVNAQYIMTSNHMGTHLDAPRHFVTGGMTIDEIPLDWLYGPGVIVDLRDEMDDLALYSPEMIEKRVKIEDGDILVLHTGWHRFGQFGDTPDEERYVHYHPGPHPDIVEWLLDRKMHVWGVDAISTDHPMNLPIGRFLGKGMHGQCDRVRAAAEKKFGGKKGVDKLFPDEDYQLTHNKLFPHNVIHIENIGGQIALPQLQNKRLILGCFPWKFKGGEAAFARAVAFVDEEREMSTSSREKGERSKRRRG
jgi:arylformamidase